MYGIDFLGFLPVMLIITSTILVFSLSSSCRSFITPVSRSTEKTGPDILYTNFEPSGSTPEIIKCY